MDPEKFRLHSFVKKIMVLFIKTLWTLKSLDYIHLLKI